MTDRVSPGKRREIMARVRSRDTKPEMLVRSLLHGLGYRFTTHDERLPGRPDLVFTARRKVVFVHGCFWHGHDCPMGDRLPKSNRAYWKDKITRNVVRDAEQLKALTESGWKSIVVWECHTRRPAAITRKLVDFLGPTRWHRT